MKWEWDKFYDKAYNWVLSYGPQLLMAIILLFIGLFLIRIFNRWLKRMLTQRNFNPSLRYFLQNLLAITMQILLILMVMQVAGIQLTFFAAIVAGLSVAAGLALSGTLQNFVSGVLILFLKPYKVGDLVNTQGQEGTVTAIQLFYTTVLTYDNKTIIIPNGQLSNNVVINLSREGIRRMDIELRFGYGISAEQVKKVMLATAQQGDSLLQDPAPRVGISVLDVDKFAVMLSVWTRAPGFVDTRYDLQERILKALMAAGIKLPGM